MLNEKTKDLIEKLKSKNMKLATAESCTGGLIAALLTEIPGSSAVFESGFVTYSDTAKTKMLGVDAVLIKEKGAVSEEVAKAMAEGALGKAGVDITVAVTGIAGPSGGSTEKPVGLVYIAVATKDKTICEKNIFTGDRQDIRASSLIKSLILLQKGLE